MNIVIAYDSYSLDSLVDVTFLSEPHGLISVVLFSKDNFCYYIFFSFFFCRFRSKNVKELFNRCAILYGKDSA